MSQNNRSIGNQYEDRVCEYLKSGGVRIMERNFRNRFGEIDIIGYDGEYLVFFEVKYRKDAAAGFAQEAVGQKKMHTICKVSDYYRTIHGIGDFSPIRYDVVAVNENEISWVKNAFPYC